MSDGPRATGLADYRRRMRVIVLAAFAVLAACSNPCDDARLSAAAKDGCRSYHAACVKCHNGDPRADGMLGPAIAGSSLELLEHKVLKKTYPPGYQPKRPGSDTMRQEPLEHLRDKLPQLAAYLQEVANLK